MAPSVGHLVSVVLVCQHQLLLVSLSVSDNLAVYIPLWEGGINEAYGHNLPT